MLFNGDWAVENANNSASIRRNNELPEENDDGVTSSSLPKNMRGYSIIGNEEHATL